MQLNPLLEPVMHAMKWKVRDILKYTIQEAIKGERYRCAGIARNWCKDAALTEEQGSAHREAAAAIAARIQEL